MAEHCGSTLWALGELGGMPAVRGLAGTQAHLRGFTFRNSHDWKVIRLFLRFELIQRVPSGVIRFFAQGRGGRALERRGTFGPAIGITSRMRGQGEENIFTYLRGQVHGFMSIKWHLDGKQRDTEGGLEWTQA